MNSQAPLVDDVHVIEPEKARRSAKGRARAALVVRFAGGSVARLDPENPRDRTWREVLESLRGSKEPAYVEVDPETSYITSLLLPRSFLVTAMHPAQELDGFEVELEISHARHYLRKEHPRFAALAKLLDDARRTKTPVLVTEDVNGDAIVDVRPATRVRPGRRKKT